MRENYSYLLCIIKAVVHCDGLACRCGGAKRQLHVLTDLLRSSCHLLVQRTLFVSKCQVIDLLLVLCSHLLIAEVDTSAQLVVVFVAEPAQIGPGFDACYLRENRAPKPSEGRQTKNYAFSPLLNLYSTLPTP